MLFSPLFQGTKEMDPIPGGVPSGLGNKAMSGYPRISQDTQTSWDIPLPRYPWISHDTRVSWDITWYPDILRCPMIRGYPGISKDVSGYSVIPPQPLPRPPQRPGDTRMSEDTGISEDVRGYRDIRGCQGIPGYPGISGYESTSGYPCCVGTGDPWATLRIFLTCSPLGRKPYY